MKNLKLRLSLLNFLEFAVWGAYLTSMGTYLAGHGLSTHIGWFYSIQGIVSLFMPALMGIVADRWIPAQKLLSICHAVAGSFMIGAGVYGIFAGDNVQFATLFVLYTISVAFFMPTLALNNSVAFTALDSAGMDIETDFTPVRVFGTVGFIVTMWLVDLCGFQPTSLQFIVSGGLSIVMALYALTMPACPVGIVESRSIVEALGLKAFAMFKQKKMAIFFIFSMLLGMCLQITNSYANPFITSFGAIEKFAGTFGVQHANILISISQICEALCILAIPFFLKHCGIKNVMLMAMIAWVLRFGLFGLGNPGFPGVLLFVLSCIVYGFAFDFFNISGGMYVDQEVDISERSSAQGLFMMMTNGLGATIGTLSAQAIVNHFVYNEAVEAQGAMAVWHGWQASWFIFAGFALVVAIAFWIIFPNTEHTDEEYDIDEADEAIEADDADDTDNTVEELQ